MPCRPRQWGNGQGQGSREGFVPYSGRRPHVGMNSDRYPAAPLPTSSAHFFNWVACLSSVYTASYSSLYLLDPNLLLRALLAKVISQSVSVSHSVWYTVNRGFTFNPDKCINMSLYCLLILCLEEIISFTSITSKSSPCFLLDVLSFCFSHFGL